MTHDSAGLSNVPAPCLVDQGIVVNKTDMLRLLKDLGQVAYTDIHDHGVLNRGTGYVMDVFAEPGVSTLVANQSLYLNVQSFDYIQLDRLPNDQACFKLFQESRCLQLVPLTSPIKEQSKQELDTAAIQEIVAEALSASWDACLDDNGTLT